MLVAQFRIPLRRRDVVVVEILPHHPVGAEPRDQGLHGLPDRQKPVVGHPFEIALEIQRHDLFFQKGVQEPGVVIIALFPAQIFTGDGGPDGPAVLAVVPFAPPAVGDAEVDPRVDGHLLAAGSTGLVGTAGSVEPHVAALNHEPRHRKVVILYEEYLSEEAGVEHVADHFLQHVDALRVGGMGLAGEDEDHRALRIAHDAGQTIQIRKKQRRPLVRRKPPGKTDDQRRRRKTGRHFLLLFVGNGELLEKFRQRSPEIIQKLLLLELPHRPEALVRDFVYLAPDGRIRALLLPAGAKHVIQQRPHGRPRIRRHMDAVGDVPDGDLRLGHALPAFLPHMAGNVSVQGAHAVGPERIIQSQHRHFENIALAPFKPPHPHEFRPRQADALGIRQEVRLHPFQPETLVPGVHGRMRRKQAASAHEFPRFGEGEPPLLHKQADTLKDEERGMPLVHMIHGGPDAEGAHELDPAHAEQDFLTETAIPVRLVQPGGDLAIVGGIAGRVGVQQIQLDPPHTHHPDLRMETPPRKLQQHFERRSALILDQLQRQRGEIVFGVLGDLPPVPVDLLPEIPAPIQQSHAHKRDIQIACRFQVIAGQDAEPARINRQALAQAVLRREIGRRALRRQRAEVLCGNAHVGVKGLHCGLIQPQVGLVMRHDEQTGLGRLFDDRHGIVSAAFPLRRIERGKQLMAFGMPAPPQVMGQLAQPPDGLRQRGDGGKGVQGRRRGHRRLKHPRQGCAARRVTKRPTLHGLVQGLRIRLNIVGEKPIPRTRAG